MKLRRLREEGINCFERYLDSLTTENPFPYPRELLTGSAVTEIVEPGTEVEERSFNSRFEAAEYLNDKLGEIGIRDVERDIGIWCWLSLFYFDQLCPLSGVGKRKPGERARWIPVVSDYRKYYRHLLAGPFRIYRAHRDDPERAKILLCTEVGRPGDIVEQLASRQELVTNPAVIEAATLLYLDRGSGRPKRGAAGRGPGSARRFAEVLNQFDINWDLYYMSTKSVVEILPREFDKFLPKG